MIRAVAALLLAAVALALQQPAPIPPYPGDGNPQHDGQPAWCQNTDSPEHTHNCSCMDMADESCDKGAQESAKCKVYCRKSACRCRVKCDHDTRR